ncbi:hypothetical protein QVD99_002088 [Batrachochytrium dendrobatidis]|nr:hypothetical protein O5D80_005853 [Batrachochytrium dendrobatidis]KAK5671370.1 hypothetical protein QVD99_002088 [Batrachochytrium dendrobatidis]
MKSLPKPIFLTILLIVTITSHIDMPPITSMCSKTSFEFKKLGLKPRVLQMLSRSNQPHAQEQLLVDHARSLSPALITNTELAESIVYNTHLQHRRIAIKAGMAPTELVQAVLSYIPFPPSQPTTKSKPFMGIIKKLKLVKTTDIRLHIPKLATKHAQAASSIFGTHLGVHLGQVWLLGHDYFNWCKRTLAMFDKIDISVLDKPSILAWKHVISLFRDAAKQFEKIATQTKLDIDLIGENKHTFLTVLKKVGMRLERFNFWMDTKLDAFYDFMERYLGMTRINFGVIQTIFDFSEFSKQMHIIRDHVYKGMNADLV